MVSSSELSWSDLAIATAGDAELYNRTFFPKTFRQESPPFAQQMNDILESPSADFVNFQLYRGSSKTTRSRAAMSRRIAFGVDRVMLCICASASKAEMSVRWIRRQVQYNTLWRDTFALEPGDKWTDWQLEIRHKTLGESIWVLAFGLEGSHRGINIDDYRPSFIYVDDIIDEENSASKLQRQKAEDLVLGSLIHSLTPTSENPEAKLVISQTPFHKEDFSMKSLKDPRFTSMQQGCWTKETENLPLEYRESVWPQRWPSTQLRGAKLSFQARNKGSVFSREMECKLVTPETSDFRIEWLKYYDPIILTDEFLAGMTIVLAIDPVPPPTEIQLERDLHKNDFECLSVVGYRGGNYYLLDYSINRGHTPEWTISEMFRLAYKWRVKKVVVEVVAYQKTLEWLIREAMARQGRYWPVESFRDRRAKPNRINDSFGGISSHGKLYVQSTMLDFITQYEDYPKVTNDDVIDSVSIALCSLTVDELADDQNWGSYGDDDNDFRALSYSRGSP